MRVAIAGLQHESNTFAAAPTGWERFVEDGLLEGNAVFPRWSDAHHEFGGFIGEGRRLGFELVPLLMTKATPAGPVEHSFVREIADKLISGLARCHADGLLLALHGAMVTTEQSSGDEFVLRKLRDAVGPGFPIVVTLDFHGNLTDEMVACSNAILFYQTNPHTDMRAKGEEAARLLRRILSCEARPVQAVRKPPMIVPINHQNTAHEPLRGLLAYARALEERPGILSVSIAAGFPYADVPAMGPAIVVVTNNDQALAERAADDLADRLWEARSAMRIDLPNVERAVTQAIASTTPPVVLVDFGDNVGGGSSADGTFLLAELVRRQASRSVVVIADAAAVQACVQAGVGASVALEVGGKTDELHGQPVSIQGTVRTLSDGRWIETQARHGGVRFNDQGTSAVIRWGDENFLCVTRKRYPPFSLGQLTSLGIDPSEQQILVVKAAIAYRAAYEPIAGQVIEVDTPGLTAVNPRHFRYTHIRRPIWPLDTQVT